LTKALGPIVGSELFAWSVATKSLGPCRHTIAFALNAAVWGTAAIFVYFAVPRELDSAVALQEHALVASEGAAAGGTAMEDGAMGRGNDKDPESAEEGEEAIPWGKF
jgi:hypothetical protein